MDHDKSVAQRVSELSDAERGELWRLCEARRQREDRGGAGEVPHYETGVPGEIAEALDVKGLVHRLGPLTAATHLVYGYYQRNGIGVTAG